MNEPVVELVAKAFPALKHPGVDGGEPFDVINPAFSTRAMPSAQAQQFAEAAGLPHPDIARLSAEAVVALIETDHEIVSKAELAALRSAAEATVEHRHKVVAFGCNCGHPHHKIRANIQNYGTDHPTLHMPALIHAVAAMNPNCGAAA